MDGHIQGQSESVGTGVGKEAGLPPWVDASLVEKTQKVWGRYDPKGLTTDEAVEVMINVSQLLETLTVSQEEYR